jgi:hypothetical protein
VNEYMGWGMMCPLRWQSRSEGISEDGRTYSWESMW